MSQGKIHHSEKQLREDLMLHEEIPVYQLTSKGKLNYCQYFTHQSWIPGTHELVFTSDRAGTHDLYKVEVNTGEITRLTENKKAWPFAWAISKDGKFIIYYSGEGNSQVEFHLLDLASLEDKLILKRPARYDGWTKTIISILPDNDTFFVNANLDGAKIPSNVFRGSISNKTLEPLFPEEDEKEYFFDHVVPCPTNPDLILMNKTHARDLNGDAPQRMWLLNVKTREMVPLYKHKKNLFNKMERVGHECWHPSGEFVIFVVRRNKLKACSIHDTFGKENDWVVGKGPNFWHVSLSPKGNLACADTMWKDTGLWLVEFKKGIRGEMFNLCLTKSAWQHAKINNMDKKFNPLSQAHPHPGWSPDGRFINFTRFDAETGAVHLNIVDLRNINKLINFK
ncbi:MAG: TolB family protein [Promethearchaeota archaeon]